MDVLWHRLLGREFVLGDGFLFRQGLAPWLPWLFAVAVLSNGRCAPGQTTGVLTNGALAGTAGLSVSNVPSPALASAASAGGLVADSDYKLRVGDRVSFQIAEDREPARSLVVADSGELDVPYVGRVAAAGKSCRDLARSLKVTLEQEFYYRATVVLAVDAANRFLGRVYVWGQVKNQGPIDLALNENLTAGKAILRAGGFADFANRKRVKVLRCRPGDPKSRQVFELNMTEILEDGKTEKDVALEPDDSVIVPARLINF